MEQEDWPKYTHAVESISDSHIYIYDIPRLTIPQFRSISMKLKNRHGLDLVIVDYLGLMEGIGENRVQQVSYISRNLKVIAGEVDVPIIALHQMNRAIEQRGDGKPVLSDLRDSGSIEQDADQVLFLYSGDNSWIPTAQINYVNASLPKQRNGPIADNLKFAVHTFTTKFDNAFQGKEIS